MERKDGVYSPGRRRPWEVFAAIVVWCLALYTWAWVWFTNLAPRERTPGSLQDCRSHLQRTGWAIRDFHQARGRWPRTMQELQPFCLYPQDVECPSDGVYALDATALTRGETGIRCSRHFFVRSEWARPREHIPVILILMPDGSVQTVRGQPSRPAPRGTGVAR